MVHQYMYLFRSVDVVVQCFVLSELCRLDKMKLVLP